MLLFQPPAAPQNLNSVNSYLQFWTINKLLKTGYSYQLIDTTALKSNVMKRFSNVIWSYK